MVSSLTLFLDSCEFLMPTNSSSMSTTSYEITTLMTLYSIVRKSCRILDLVVVKVGLGVFHYVHIMARPITHLIGAGKNLKGLPMQTSHF